MVSVEELSLPDKTADQMGCYSGYSRYKIANLRVQPVRVQPVYYGCDTKPHSLGSML